jgi:hypothetical protein
MEVKTLMDNKNVEIRTGIFSVVKKGRRNCYNERILKIAEVWDMSVF